jgi:hypothetical protein
MDPPESVLNWRSSDSSVASVDRVTGDVHPHRRGSTWVSVSAGGWRHDSLRIFIVGAAATALFREDWSGSWQDRWAVFGPDPKPLVVASRRIGRAFTPNGDGTYADGAFTRIDFPANAGLAVEAIIEAPITRTKWQHIGFQVNRIDRTAATGPPAMGAGCGTLYPAGEGWSKLHLLSVPSGSVRVPDELASGRPHSLRMQIFPDGTCGIAIDGRAVSRSRDAIPVDKPVAVIIRGQSVGTRMLIGPLTVWRGVRGDVDWSVLDRDTTKAVSGGRPPG